MCPGVGILGIIYFRKTSLVPFSFCEMPSLLKLLHTSAASEYLLNMLSFICLLGLPDGLQAYKCNIFQISLKGS